MYQQEISYLRGERLVLMNYRHGSKIQRKRGTMNKRTDVPLAEDESTDEKEIYKSNKR